MRLFFNGTVHGIFYARRQMNTFMAIDVGSRLAIEIKAIYILHITP